MKKIYETAVILIGTLGWWGFVYPELSAVTEVCEQEIGTEDEEEDEMLSFSEKVTESLGNRGIKSGDIRIKSRLLEYVYREKEKEESEKETGYEE